MVDFVDGSWLDQKKKFKGERFRSQTPDDAHDWVLYLRREGKKQGYNSSFKLESKRAKVREVETAANELPFEIQFPAESELAAGKSYDFNGTRTKSTLAAWRAFSSPLRYKEFCRLAGRQSATCACPW